LNAAAVEAAVIIVVDEKNKQTKGRTEKFPSPQPKSKTEALKH
jgi:hypothetical protein